MLRAINTAGLSDIEKRVVKATYDDTDPPKLKHVEALILMSTDVELVPFIDKRLINPQWNVAFKALILSHRLMQEGSARFLDEIAEYPSLFVLDSTVSGDYESSTYAPFIEKYALYLTRKIAAFRALNVCVERHSISQAKKWASKLSNMHLIQFIPALQSQFTCIMKCSNNQLNHPIVIAAMSCIIKDAFRLYSILTLLMMMILERYETFSLPQTEQMLQSTHKFILQNRKFRKWASALAKNGFVQKKVLPNFDAIPDTFLQLLEEHIESLGGVVERPTINQPVNQADDDKSINQSRLNKSSPRQGRYEEDEEPTPRRSNGQQSNTQSRRVRDDEYDLEEEKSSRPLRRAPSNNQSTTQSVPPPTRRVVSNQSINQSTAASAYRERARDEYDEDYDEPPRRTNQPINQSTNQSISRSGNQKQPIDYDDEPVARGRGRADDYDEPVRQPRNQSTNQSVNRSPNQSINQPRQARQVVIPIDLHMDEPVEDHYYDEQPARAPRRSPPHARPVNQSINQSMNQPINQSINQPSRNARAAPRMIDEDDELDFLRSAPIDETAEMLAMFAPPTPIGQKQPINQSINQQSINQSNNQSINQSINRRPVQPMTAKSRDQARAAIATSLNQDLDLFQDFDLHPAEQEALDRDQQAINAAFFGQSTHQSNNQSINQSRVSSHTPPPPTPPPRYEPSEPNFDDIPPQKPPKTHQSINQSTNQPSINQSMNQLSVNQSTNQPSLFNDDDLLVDKPRSSRPKEPLYDDQSINQSTNQTINQSKSRQYDDQSINQSTSQSKPRPRVVREPVYDDEDDYVPPPPRARPPPPRANNQSINQSANQSINQSINQPRPPPPQARPPPPVHYDSDEQLFVDPFSDLNTAVDPHTMQPVIRNTTRRSVNQSINQSNNQSINQSNKQSINQSRANERPRRTKAEAAMSAQRRQQQTMEDEDDEDFT